MRPYRTVLFVPAHKTSWYAKAAASRPDAICFDL
jgi:citrate lyase subunit beta / citryl-CoA lyase